MYLRTSFVKFIKIPYRWKKGRIITSSFTLIRDKDTFRTRIIITKCCIFNFENNENRRIEARANAFYGKHETPGILFAPWNYNINVKRRKVWNLMEIPIRRRPSFLFTLILDGKRIWGAIFCAIFGEPKALWFNYGVRFLKEIKNCEEHRKMTPRIRFQAKRLKFFRGTVASFTKRARKCVKNEFLYP